MPKSVLSEIYFVVGMMILIMILSVAAVYYFVRQFRREKTENKELQRVDQEVSFRETTIKNYIDGYNRKDVEQMMADMADDVVFQNIAAGKVDLRLEGVDEFRAQAEKVKNLFSIRRQSIRTFAHHEDETTVKVDFYGVFADDVSDEIRAGDEINISGVSIFQFYRGKIVMLTDKS